MDYIKDRTEIEKELEWNEFAKTGEVLAYLKYKGIFMENAKALTEMRRGEYWHSLTQKELSQEKLNTETPREF